MREGGDFSAPAKVHYCTPVDTASFTMATPDVSEAQFPPVIRIVLPSDLFMLAVNVSIDPIKYDLLDEVTTMPGAVTPGCSLACLTGLTGLKGIVGSALSQAERQKRRHPTAPKVTLLFIVILPRECHFSIPCDTYIK
jgi:hypothetical protein